ncbi:hypothetical protein J2S40_001139 [Nocardioides luteus]|nr:hypothetical protein [Nocardioides luteus]MDR7310081.1 hypothetical protein [Nocardioides luteus]
MFAKGEHAFERVVRGCPSFAHTLEGMKGNEVQCPCCKLFYQGMHASGGSYRPALTTSGYCRDCVNHQGDSKEVRKLRAQNHFRMLRLIYPAMRAHIAAAQREVAAADRRTEDARRELEVRPTRVLVRVENLDKLVVAVAHEEREEAYERRDKAMGALSDLRRLHHQDPDNRRRCSCGDLFHRCEVAQIVKWQSIVSWEEHQVRLSEQGERHFLARDHPALRDKTWFLTRYEPDFEEQYEEPA